MLELADEADSKSVGSDTVRVRPPPPAPKKRIFLLVDSLILLQKILLVEPERVCRLEKQYSALFFRQSAKSGTVTVGHGRQAKQYAKQTVDPRHRHQKRQSNDCLFLSNLKDWYVISRSQHVIAVRHMFSRKTCIFLEVIRLTDIWQRLKNEARPILLWGTGNGADKIVAELEAYGIAVSGVFASDGFVRERYYKGFRVLSLADADALFGDFVALFSFGSDRPEVLENIKRVMARHTLLAPEVPVAGGEIFNLEYASKNGERLHRVYSLLSDEQSKKVFKNTVLFKLTGDISLLFGCETDKDEVFDSVLNISGCSSFLDLGAYSGDTVLDFVRRVDSLSHITAVEPDKKSFLKLCRNTERLGALCVNAAVSESDGEVLFGAKASRGSSIGEGSPLPAVTVDNLARDKSFDYIKFDVEGAELSAIRGAEKTIKRDTPKMRIAAYHKSADYFTIPEAVLSINPDYDIYMRHHPSVPAWDTDFFFVPKLK